VYKRQGRAGTPPENDFFAVADRPWAEQMEKVFD
jgi:hypothetical protein